LVYVYAIGGGALVGTVDYDDAPNVEHLAYDIELATRNWSRGYVPCSECGVLLTRFSDDIAGRYMSGVYCKTCWPRYEAMKTREVD
jgi:hypothetical protein